MNDAVLLTLRILTACSSTIMILSPAPAMYKIYKTQSVGHMSIVALATLLGNCHMWCVAARRLRSASLCLCTPGLDWGALSLSVANLAVSALMFVFVLTRMLHGYLRHNIFPVFITFGVGDLIALAFIAIYVRYTTERAYVLKVLGFTVAVLAVVTLYALLALNGVTHQTRDQVTPIIGYIAIVAAVLLYGAPFEKVLVVLRHKSSVFIPFAMVLVGTINNALWVIYTPLDHNWFMFVPNMICLVLGLAQLSLYWFYHPSRRQLDAPLRTTSIDFGDDDSGIPVAIVIDSPKTDLTTGKAFPESPSYHVLHSPLAPPLTVVEIDAQTARMCTRSMDSNNYTTGTRNDE